MPDKVFNSRIIHKHDVEANWIKAVNFTPKQGEIIVYDIDDTYNYERFKIGDGKTFVSALPFYAGSWEDLSDRPFGTETSLSKTTVHERVINGHIATSEFGYNIGSIEGKNVVVTINGTEYSGKCEFEGTTGKYEITLDNGTYKISQNVTDATSYFITPERADYNIKLEVVEEVVTAIPLDEMYIPDTIARVTDLEDTRALIGDTAVSEQISAAQIVYVGPTQPTDPNIKVWINTAEDGVGVVPVLPRVATITLAANAWTGGPNPYSQVVTINTVTAATKIDLQPTAQQILALQNEDIALMAENASGVVTIYAFGGKPSADMTMQVLLTEVSYV